MREDWLRAQDRRRRLVASGWTAAAYAAFFFFAWGLGLLKPANLADMAGAVMVSLDGSEGLPGGTPLGLELAPPRPANAPVESPAPAAPKTGVSAPAPRQPAPKPLPPAPSAVGEPGPQGLVPKEEPKPAAPPQPAPAPQAAAAPAEPAAPTVSPNAPVLEAPPASRTFGTPAPAGAPGSAPGVPGGSGSVTFRGSEKGNLLDTVFGASSGTIGRSLYVPVYLYMPLPAVVEDAVYQKIPASADGYNEAEGRKTAFRMFYASSGGAWRLKGAVPFAQRSRLWLMLEDAGYDLARADYKAAAGSGSVVIEFAVSPATAVSKPSLVDLRVVAGSGSPEIDEAVIYGFRQAAFFNKNAFAVSGKFAYRFGK